MRHTEPLAPSGEGRVECFTGKYEKESALLTPIVNNFFQAVQSLVPSDAQRILEIGCGPGYSTRRLRQIFQEKHFEASDLEESCVYYARALNSGLTILQESIYALNREPGSFDLLICLEVFEHLKQPVEALREVSRVSARYAIFSVPNEPLWRILNFCRGKYCRQWGNTPGHRHHWSPRAFQEFATREFEVLAVRKPIPWTVLLLKKKET